MSEVDVFAERLLQTARDLICRRQPSGKRSRRAAGDAHAQGGFAAGLLRQKARDQAVANQVLANLTRSRRLLRCKQGISQYLYPDPETTTLVREVQE